MTEAHPLAERAHEAPESPGVYRFQDARGKVLYVGKARDLRRRVLSYFGRSGLPERTRAMLERARRLDFTVTASEVEAFILENTLIKRHRPRFNVLLRDDKTYPYIKVTTGEDWPRVFFTRTVRDDGHTYFGPFMGQRMARRLMDLARTHFQVRTCHIEIDGKLPRPCLYYHMKACLGPCVDGLTDAASYAAAVDELRLFLDGRHRELLPRLEASMWAASEAENFELASRYRDLMAVVHRLSEPQDVCARIGDSSFALMAKRPLNKNLLELAESLVQAVAGHRFAGLEADLQPGISLGLCFFDAAPDDAAGLVNRAIMAGRLARKAGGGRLQIHGSQQDEQARAEPRDTLSLLKEALQNNGFQVLFHHLHIHFHLDSHVIRNGNGGECTDDGNCRHDFTECVPRYTATS